MGDNGRYKQAEAALSEALGSVAPQPGGTAGRRAPPTDFAEFGERQMQNFEASRTPMRIFDRETLRFLAANDAASKLYGYTREEFLTLRLTDTRHPDEHASMYASLAGPADYIAHWGDRRHVAKSGDVLVVETVTQDILFNGRKARLSLTIDMTERNRIPELLRQRQQEFMTLAEHSPDIISRLDRDFRHLYVSPAITATTGLPPDEFIGKTVAEVGLPPGTVDRWEAVLKEAFSTGREQILECVYEVSGTSRYYESRIIPERDTGGAVATVLVLTRDFTEHKSAELALRCGAALAGLLESLARAANEAVTPEAAMTACLEQVCAYGGWVLGRVELFERGRPGDTPGRSIWYAPEYERFAEFIQITNGRVHIVSGPFIGRLLRERTAVWIDDLRKRKGFGRWEAAIRHNLRSAFAFPIIVRGDVVAIMEVFGEEIRPKDALAMGAAQSIASQLARIVEREWAHQANARTAAIVESSHDAIISRALDGTILTWNIGAERLFGYTAAEIVGRNLGVLYPPELKPKLFSRQRLMLQGKAMAAFETVRIAKDGRRIQVSLSSAPIRDSSGEAWGISTIMRDITEQKLAEQALRESERRLAADLDAMTRLQAVGSLFVRESKMPAVLGEIVETAIAITDADMGNIQILDAQSRHLKIVAQRGFEKAWLGFWDRVFEGDGACGAALERGERVVVEDVTQSPIFAGTPALQVQLEAGVRAVQSTPLLSRSGQLLGAFSTHYRTPRRPDERELRLLDLLARHAADIIERAHAEAALAGSEERFRQLAENIDQVFWIDTPGCDNNLYVSPAYEKVWGRSVESLRRNPNGWWDAVHPEDQARLRDAAADIARGRHMDIEYRIVRPDGTIRWIRDRSYPMKGGDGGMLACGIAEDITVRKQAEQERLTQAIHQRDALVREVHHRIKNNLQGVVGLLRQKIRKFPAVAPGIEEAIVQLQTVAVVYGLQGTRTDGLLSLAEMVEAICASAEGLIGGHVDLVFERKSPRLACVAGSEAVSMAVALNELVFNAMKHQPAPAGKKRAQVVLCETKNAAEIRITNHGRLPKSFDFSAGRAVGNGLELVRTLLVSPGASIDFNNGRNKVEVVVRLRPPLLAMRQTAIERRGKHGSANEKKAATAHPGRG